MIESAVQSTIVPATPNQERVLLSREVARRLGRQPKPDLIGLVIEVVGPLAVERLRRAIQATVDKHASLRTHIVKNLDLDEPEWLAAIERFSRTGLSPGSLFLQRVSVATRADLVLRTLSAGLSETDAELRDIIGTDLSTPFAETECSLRAQLIGVGDKQSFLLLTVDHLLGDGWSLEVLFRDIVDAYADPDEESRRTATAEIAPPGYACSYDGEQQDTSYWAERWSKFAADRLPARALPFATPSSTAGVPQFRSVNTVLSGEELLHIKSLVKTSRTTLYRLFVAAVLVVLQHYTKRTRLAIWAHCANRSHAIGGNAVGFLMNTHLMGFELSPYSTGYELIASVSAEHNNTLRHERLPLSVLWQKLQTVPRFADSGFLVDYVSIQPSTQTFRSELGPVSFSRSYVGLTPLARSASLGVYVRDLGDRIVLQSDFSEQHYDSSGVRGMIDDIRSIIELLTQDCSATVADLQRGLTRANGPALFSPEMGDFLLADSERLSCLLRT